MKTIPTLLLPSLAFVVALAFSSAQAQTPPPDSGNPPPADATDPANSEHHFHKHPHFIEQLKDLTDDQKAQIKHIKETVTDKKEAHEQIMAVLTPEQKEELKKMMEEWRKNHPHPEGHGPDHDGAPGASGAPAQ